MTNSHDGEDPGFWPGYVAATAGLVQGMLIMSMALGIAIFALSSVSSGGPEGSVRPIGPGGPLDVAPTLPALAPEPIPQRMALPAAAPVPDAALRPIRIAFEGDATITPSSTANVIGNAISERAALGVRRWLLVSAGDLSDPRQSRAAYVRLMGVRAVLMNVGVPANAIEMRMDNAGPSAAGTDGGAVVIESLVGRNPGASNQSGEQP